MGDNLDSRHVSRHRLRESFDSRTDSHAGDHIYFPVRIHCLGRFVALLNNEPVHLPRSRQQKPLELLQALIAFGGRDVHTELLCQALWLDADGDDAQNAYDVTLYRLRKLFPVKGLFTQRDQKLTINNDIAWVDVWIFERLINQGERTIESALGSEDLHLLKRTGERLLSLYQGAFLERETVNQWSLSLRERLRSKLLRHMRDAGKIWELRSDWATATRYYEKGLEVEPLAEELYQRLMQSHFSAGHTAEALLTFRRCEKALTEHLGIEPSEQTRNLYASIKN